MINLLKEIILDFQEHREEIGIERELKIKTVPKKATICVGVRRCGKSTLMLQQIEHLLESGNSIKNIVHLNFFDDRLHALQQLGLNNILEAYYSIYPEKKNTEIVYFFFDELQVIDNWELFIERIMRTEKCEVYITGSSAHMLSIEIATQLRGRSLSWELFPFSFCEYLRFKNIDIQDPLTSKNRLIIQKIFEEYWETGGFPEVANLDHQLRVKIHQEYFNAIIYRDLIERHNISNPRAILDTAHWLIDNIGSLYSINSLLGYLKSLGHKIQKYNVSEYLKWFEDAYFLFSIRIFDGSLKKSNVNPKKIFCIDHSLVTSISSGILINSGHLLENLVFVAIRQINSNIFYYKTKNGKEIDFVIKKKRQIYLIQVCETLADSKTRKREIDALNEAMTELKISKSILITKHEQENIIVTSGEIEILPIWLFLFDIKSLLKSLIEP